MAEPHRRNRRTSLTPIPASAPVVGVTPTKPTYAKRRPGRPTLMTPDVVTRYLNAVRAGNNRHVAARFVGMNPETVEWWIKRGRGQVKEYPGKPEHVEFARMVDEAEAAAEVMVIGNLTARSRIDTAAGVFIASRRWPQRWPGKPDDSAPDAAPTVVVDQRQQNQNVIVVTEGQLGELVHQLLATQRADRAVAEPDAVIEDRREDRVIRHDHLDALRADDTDA